MRQRDDRGAALPRALRGPLRAVQRLRVPVGAAFAVALLLVLGLALEGVRASRRQRALAETALVEEATVVASRISNSLVTLLYQRLTSQFGQTRHLLDASEAGPPPALAAALAKAGADVDACRCLGEDPALGYLAGYPGGVPTLIMRRPAGAPPPAVLRALVERASAQAPDPVAPVEVLFARIGRAGPTYVLMFRRASRGGRPLVVGLLSDVPTFFGTAGAHVIGRLRSFRGGRQPVGGGLAPLVELRLTLADGTVAYQSGPIGAGATVGMAMTGHLLQRLRVETALSAADAARVIAQRLPAERGPLLLAAAVGAAALMGVALLQYRREQELARLRTDFTASVSHELRTPLSQILLFGETLILNRVRSEDERRDAATVIVQETQRLMHMVENVLHLARSERHMLRVAPVPLAIGPATRELVETFRPLLTEARIQCRLEVSDGVLVLADRGAYRQVLLNLLDNAAKYGPAGQCITVTVANVVAGGGGDRVPVRVDDEGPGVPAEDRGRIWAPFVRRDETLRAGITGSGIGLAVVRELVALHDGRVEVSDAPRGGARFTVELPVVGWGQDVVRVTPASCGRPAGPPMQRAG